MLGCVSVGFRLLSIFRLVAASFKSLLLFFVSQLEEEHTVGNIQVRSTMS